MITIAVLSDTHVPSRKSSLPKEVLCGIDKADYIIHAGDHTEMAVVERLEQIACLHAVSGNMDSPEVKLYLPYKKVVEIGGVKIGVTHGDGAHLNYKKRIFNLFKDDNVHCIISGHTHHASSEVINNVLFFNPGSTISRFGSKPSFGLVFITDLKEIVPEIITF